MRTKRSFRFFHFYFRRRLEQESSVKALDLMNSRTARLRRLRLATRIAALWKCEVNCFQDVDHVAGLPSTDAHRRQARQALRMEADPCLHLARTRCKAGPDTSKEQLPWAAVGVGSIATHSATRDNTPSIDLKIQNKRKTRRFCPSPLEPKWQHMYM